jgi:hypothetical protein
MNLVLGIFLRVSGQYLNPWLSTKSKYSIVLGYLLPLRAELGFLWYSLAYVLGAVVLPLVLVYASMILGVYFWLLIISLLASSFPVVNWLYQRNEKRWSFKEVSK